MAKTIKGFRPEILDDLEALTGSEKAAPKETQARSSWIENSERAIPLGEWSDFVGIEKLHGWASDIGQLRRDSLDDPIWEIVGRGALIQSSNELHILLTARLIAHDAGLAFAVIDGDQFKEDPVAVLKQAIQQGPMLLCISHGEWIQSPQYAEPLRQALAAETGLVVVAAVPSVAGVPHALRAPGVLDRSFLVPSVPPEMTGKLILSMFGEELCSSSLLKQKAKVGQLLANVPVPMVESLRLHLKRVAHRERRQVELADIIDVVLREALEADISKQDTVAVRSQVAYHEAGHAAMAIIDSAGDNVPEYASISGAEGFKGVVVPSLDAAARFDGDFVTYRDFRHQIRISLGGRAAEELIYGPEYVCTGAMGDLDKATKTAIKAMAAYGFAPEMEKPGQSGSNLAVLISEPDAMSLARLHELARQMLAAEYQATLAMLAANRPLLDAIQQRLLVDPVVDQSELHDIIATAGVNLA